MLGNRRILAAAFALAATPGPARGVDLSGEIALVSDYRYRGISLSDAKPALQASFDADWETGFHSGLWLSTIEDEGAGPLEADANVGYTFPLSQAISLDLSATYYAYMRRQGANSLELSATVGASRGAWTTSLGASVAPAQDGTRDEEDRKRSNVYAVAGLSYRFEKFPLTARASLGFERGAWDGRADGGKLDWGIGADLDLGRGRLSLDAVGSNAGGDTMVGGIIIPF